MRTTESFTLHRVWFHHGWVQAATSAGTSTTSRGPKRMSRWVSYGKGVSGTLRALLRHGAAHDVERLVHLGGGDVERRAEAQAALPARQDHHAEIVGPP